MKETGKTRATMMRLSADLHEKIRREAYRRRLSMRQVIEEHLRRSMGMKKDQLA